MSVRATKEAMAGFMLALLWKGEFMIFMFAVWYDFWKAKLNGSCIILLVLFWLNVKELMFLFLKGCCWSGWKNRTRRYASPGRYLIKLFSVKEKSWNLPLYSELSLCKLTLFVANFYNNLWMSVVFLTIQSWSIW